jgi:carbon starvation protein
MVQMNAATILIGAALLLILAYRYYGRFIAARLAGEKTLVTPAHRLRDDVDYVPTRPWVLLGHHFASIAGASPIVGPIIALLFGWLPGLIWLLVGGIFMGAVHDLAALIVSLRHDGQSIGVVIEKTIGRNGKRLFLLFAIATLILVVAVFTDIVARTFATNPATGLASGLFILVALFYGRLLRSRAGLAVVLPLGLFLLLLAILAGIFWGAYLVLAYETWVYIILVYIFIAAVTPVGLLLQPRDFLNSFLLLAMMVFAIVAIIVARPELQMPALGGLTSDIGPVFPLLFVTIACGAISGFHSLVASGTSAKQLASEAHAKPVAYGGMLIETLLAIIALLAVAAMQESEYAAIAAIGPVALFAQSIAAFLAPLGLAPHFGIVFISLAVSAFALTSLDTSTRLARFAVEELFGDEAHFAKMAGRRYLATLLIIICGAVLTLSGQFQVIWPIFGSANQMLAALALLAVTLWLMQQKRASWFVSIPMVFMMLVTISSLILLIRDNLFLSANYPLAGFAGALLGLSIYLLVLARKRLRVYLSDQQMRQTAGN